MLLLVCNIDIMFCSIVKLEVKAGYAVGQTYPVGETFHEQALSLIFSDPPIVWHLVS